MKITFGKAALCAVVVLFQPLFAAAAEDWQQITHGGLSFSIPADWQNLKQRSDEGQWGIRDKESKQGVLFGITRERRPERQFERARKEGMKVEQMARVEFGALGAERYRISGNSKDLGEVEFQVTVLDSMLPDGDRVTYSAGAINQSTEAVAQTLERVVASVQPTEALVSTLTGSSRQQIFDGVLSIEVRNNWERSDYSDEASWEPPRFSLWGGRLLAFKKGYGLTGSNGLLSKLVEPRRERIELFGAPGWKISGTGVATTYEDAMRRKAVPATTTVHMSDTCLAPGERFGYAISGSEAQLAEYREEVDAILASITLQLPESAGPCDELLPYAWKKSLKIAAPRSWSRDMNRDFQFSFFGWDLVTDADVKLYAYHGNAEQHPVVGEGYEPAETVARLTIDGYPATHYRKLREDGKGTATGYDYYVLDTRMRHGKGSPAFLYFDFVSTPPASAALNALQRRMLATVELGDEWQSETPVARVTEPAAEAVPLAREAAPDPEPGVVAEPQTAAPESTVGKEASEETSDLPETVEPALQPETEHPPEAESMTVEPSEPPLNAADGGADAASASPEPEVADDARKARYDAARSLREEGASLQRQGDLRGALQKYRESLARFPDPRLEAHAARIEALLQQ